MDYKVKVVMDRVNEVLKQTSNNNYRFDKNFQKLVNNVKELSKDEKLMDEFVSFTRNLALFSGESDALQRGEEAIGLVTSTIPRMISTCFALKIPMRSAYEYEKLLALSQKQSLAKKISKERFSKRDHLAGEKYGTLSYNYKHKAITQYKNMDIIDRTMFNEYLIYASQNIEKGRVDFGGKENPERVSFLVSDPTDAFGVMRVNIDSIKDDYTFGC